MCPNILCSEKIFEKNNFTVMCFVDWKIYWKIENLLINFFVPNSIFNTFFRSQEYCCTNFQKFFLSFSVRMPIVWRWMVWQDTKRTKTTLQRRWDCKLTSLTSKVEWMERLNCTFRLTSLGRPPPLLSCMKKLARSINSSRYTLPKTATEKFEKK